MQPTWNILERNAGITTLNSPLKRVNNFSLWRNIQYSSFFSPPSPASFQDRVTAWVRDQTFPLTMHGVTKHGVTMRSVTMHGVTMHGVFECIDPSGYKHETKIMLTNMHIFGALQNFWQMELTPTA